MDHLNIDQLIDVRKAPVWVRFWLLIIKPKTYQVPGWQYHVEYKSLLGKNYFIRAYIRPRNAVVAEIESGGNPPDQR